MSDERWLVTGALGCIGTWCCRQLVREGHAVIAYDLGRDWPRPRLRQLGAPCTTAPTASAWPRTLTAIRSTTTACTSRPTRARRAYWRDDAVASVGLRPHIVYGPGRDHGMTAGPTLAMVAAVRGERYQIPFGGRAQFQYAPEAAGTITSRRTCCWPLPEDMAAERPVSTPLAAGRSGDDRAAPARQHRRPLVGSRRERPDRRPRRHARHQGRRVRLPARPPARRTASTPCWSTSAPSEPPRAEPDIARQEVGAAARRRRRRARPRRATGARGRGDGAGRRGRRPAAVRRGPLPRRARRRRLGQHRDRHRGDAGAARRRAEADGLDHGRGRHARLRRRAATSR